MITVNKWLLTMMVLHCTAYMFFMVHWSDPESFIAKQIRTTEMSLEWNSQRGR